MREPRIQALYFFLDAKEPGVRYLLMVRAFAGDSTMTSDLPMVPRGFEGTVCGGAAPALDAHRNGSGIGGASNILEALTSTPTTRRATRLAQFPRSLARPDFARTRGTIAPGRRKNDGVPDR